MARKRPNGECRLCGYYGPLTYEHVPPRAAFNDQRVIKWSGEAALGIGPDGPFPRGVYQQRGSGAYTLCGRCNSLTGHWYGRRFVDWCYQAMEILIKADGAPALLHVQYLFPLAIIKQIATMFFSINGPEFRRAHPELVRFVRNRDRKYLPPEYRFSVFYNISPRSRAYGVSARLRMGSGEIDVMSGLAFPPFGYVLSFDERLPDDRLFDISHFARFDYQEFIVAALNPVVLPVATALPGDYRTADEVREQVEKNRAARGVVAPAEADG